MRKQFILCLICAMLIGCLLLSGCSRNVPTTASAAVPTEIPKVYSNEVQVIVLLGQSNAEGASYHQYLEKTVGAEKTLEYTEGYENVQISFINTINANTSNGQFVPVKLGQGYQTDRFGPEVGMAEMISAYDPQKPVYIIKYTYGGTTLSNEWRSPSSGNTGRLYTAAVEYVIGQCQVLENMDLYPVIKAICWMQGESDASGHGYVNYKTLEENFKNDLRNDLAYYKPVDSEIGFVDAGISECVAWTQYQKVNGDKMALSQEDEYHDYIDTIAAGLKYNAEPVGAPDIYHYDSKSMVQLGHLFAQVLLEKYLEI